MRETLKVHRSRVYERIPEEIEEEEEERRGGITETVQQASENTFAVQPNPFSSQTTLAYNIKDETAEGIIKIYNAYGSEVKRIQVTGKGSVIINLDNAGLGVYYCQLYVNNRLQHTEKLILIK